MNSWHELEPTAVAYALVAILAIVVIVAMHLRRREPLLPLPRLRPGRWTGATVFAHIVLCFSCLFLASSLLSNLRVFTQWLPENASFERRSNFASPVGYTLFLATSFSALYYLNRTTVTQAGLSLLRWRPNAILGAGAFLLATPVVLGTLALCMLFAQKQPHLLERLASASPSSFEWLLIFLQAVVFAPIVEEWLFRGLLQGWLRRTNLLGHATLIAIAVGMTASNSGSSAKPTPVDPPMELQNQAEEIEATDVGEKGYAKCYVALALGAVYAGCVIVVYRPALTRGLASFMAEGSMGPAKAKLDLWTTNLFEAEGREQRTMPWSDFGSAWPAWKHRCARLSIVGSAMAFSLAHGAWHDVVPLFLLGLVLGWLAYRTQNLMPCIVLHSLFNLVAFIAIWIQAHPGTIGSDDKIATAPAAPSGIVNVSPGFWCPR